MTVDEFIDSKWFVFIIAFLLGMLIERWHIYREVEKHKKLSRHSRQIVMELIQVHGWMKNAGTPAHVLDKLEKSAVILNMINEEL